MTGAEILKQLLEYKQINANQLAKALGMKRTQGLYDILDGKVGISKKMAENLKKLYPEIDQSFLLTGSGTLISDSMITDKSGANDSENYKEKYIKQLEKENDRLNNSLESVETNLVLVRKYSEILVAWVEAFASSAPAHLSKSSEEAASWLQDIHKRLVDNLPPHAKGDISVGSLSKEQKVS